MSKLATIKKLDKNVTQTEDTLECNEGQRMFLSSNKTSVSCPSLYLSYDQAKKQLLDEGMSLEDFNELEYILRGFLQHIINKQLGI